MMPTCDVQNRRSESGFKLTKVGVTGVRKPINIKRSNIDSRNGTLFGTVDVFVDLPAEQKGSHLSRNLEVLREAIDDGTREPATGIENLASDICRRLLEKHAYASTADVSIGAEYFKRSETPLGRETLEAYEILGRASCVRGGELRKTLGVKVVGMTACPCAQETVAETLGCPEGWPVMTHNQRNVCTVLLSAGEDVDVEADELIELVEASFSSPTFELLKRGDEAAVVINAHRNPKFVEDVVRDVLNRLVERYADLPPDVDVTVRSESQESIHKHNAFAERTATLGELRS